MRKKYVSKLVVNWAASFLSVVILLSMVAAPALALVAANSVNSSSIVDSSIRTRDIKRNAINSSRIRDYSIVKEDIHSGSINKYKLTSNAVNTFKIEDGSVENQDMADSAVDSAKIADGAVGTADIADGSIANTDISGSAAISDSKINYDTIKTGHVSIHPSAFTPENSGASYTQNNGFSLRTTAPGTQSFFAPIQLPHGAKVTKVTFETLDNSTSFKVLWTLKRRIGSTLQGVASRLTTNAYATVGWQNLETTAITAGREIVDNLTYSYFVEVELNGSTTQLAVGRVLIEYTYTSPGS